MNFQVISGFPCHSLTLQNSQSCSKPCFTTWQRIWIQTRYKFNNLILGDLKKINKWKAASLRQCSVKAFDVRTWTGRIALATPGSISHHKPWALRQGHVSLRIGIRCSSSRYWDGFYFFLAFFLSFSFRTFPCRVYAAPR